MIRFRGNVLRAPTLLISGEYQALTGSLGFNVTGYGAAGSAHGWGP